MPESFYATDPPMCLSLSKGRRLWCMRARSDNIAYVLAAPGGEALSVDAPEASPILRVLEEEGLRLTQVWLTHTHADHTAGVKELKELKGATGCRVVGPRGSGGSGAEKTVEEGEELWFAGEGFRVMDTSGHSDLDLSFHASGLALCFCGDTLFTGGCGRLFAGPAAKMWESLKRLRNLPDDTLLCGGHDYTVDNYTFASQTFPQWEVFAERLREARGAAEAGKLPGPTTVGVESRMNPMLMADHPEIAEGVGMGGAPSEEVFARVRELRNQL